MFFSLSTSRTKEARVFVPDKLLQLSLMPRAYTARVLHMGKLQPIFVTMHHAGKFQLQSNTPDYFSDEETVVYNTNFLFASVDVVE